MKKETERIILSMLGLPPNASDNEIIAALTQFIRSAAEIRTKLERILKGVHLSHQNEFDILHWVSGHDPQYSGLRKSSGASIRATAVEAAVEEIINSPLGNERTIGMKHFNKHKDIDGFYSKFDSFMKQINRNLDSRIQGRSRGIRQAHCS